MTESARTKDGRSKKRPGPQHQRVVIVEAAVPLFSIHGSARVSIAQICRRADIGRQTFYRCFDDKDALIRHIYQFAVNQQIEDGLRLLQNQHPGVNFLPDLVDQIINRILDYYPYAQFLYSDAVDRQSVAYQVIDESLERTAAIIQQWFAANGLGMPPSLYLKGVMSGITWMVQYAIAAGAAAELIGEVKRSSVLMLESVLHVAERGRPGQ